MPVRDVDVSSPNLPGGTLVRAVFDRFLMQVSDRGGASGLIGGRWADFCDNALAERIGQSLPTRVPSVPEFVVERVVRLDDIPAIAARASSHKLQNPDFLIIGQHGELSIVQAADAKFSVETARAKQVSSEVVAALGQLGPLVTGLLDLDLDTAVLVPGVFLCPDHNLTHLMLQQRVGVVRTTVDRSELLLLPVEPKQFVAGLEGVEIIPMIAAKDRLPVTPADSLLATVYYFRIVRACICSWLDETGPLLRYNDARVVDEAAVAALASTLLRDATSAYNLVRRWQDRARAIQAQRQAVDAATAVSLSSKELREMVAAAGASTGEPPSINRVRRRLASWHRSRLREAFGPLHPPLPDFERTLAELAEASRALQAETRSQAFRIIGEDATIRVQRVAD